MAVSTAELIKNIQISVDMHAVSRENENAFFNISGHTYLNQLLTEKGKALPEIAVLSELDASYCYRIFSGGRTPSRNGLLRIALAMELTFDETQQVLRLYHMARLDPRCYRDAILVFAISKGYGLPQTTELLAELGEEAL
ncbi:MAG: helix-turn-helix transcriptional regulator [Eubacteriales bacterium]|nr:helix-turn-helix transcriptional regulator [Eubacteriales bacterium]